MKMMELLDAYHIPYFTGGKNISAGWIALKCPMPSCGDPSNHMGYNLAAEYFSCWRCGKHPLQKVLTRLLKINEKEVYAIIREYGGTSHAHKLEPEAIRVGARRFKYPSSTDIMGTQHKNYLRSRNFNPRAIEKEWGVLGTGPIALLDEMNYKHRIVVPIYWDRQVVSFVSRDITNRHEKRYIVCPKAREVIHHKRILYGKQEEWTRMGIAVEGVTDVWRLGPKAFATFGIEYTIAQVNQIRKSFKRVCVLYDNEPQAQTKATKLIRDLQMYGVDAFGCCVLGCDPGDMNQDDADYLVKEITRGY